MGAFGDKYTPFAFRIPGNGTSVSYWRKIMTALAQTGYDGAISIEHEDNTIGQDEGIRKSVAFLKQIIVREQASECWWKESIRDYQRTFLLTAREQSDENRYLYQCVPGVSFEVAAKKIRDAGIDMIELGCGEESGFAHCNPEELLASESRLDAFRGCIADNGLEISALSCHGNPVSPMRQQGNSVFAP